jgi:MFS family permease
MERKQLLVLSYAAVNVGALILISATSLWQFWMSAALFALIRAGTSVGAALITDMLPEETLGRGLSRFAATPWFGGVIGYIGAGFVIQTLGLQSAFATGAILPAIAGVLVVSLGWKVRQLRRSPLPAQLHPAHATQEICSA